MKNRLKIKFKKMKLASVLFLLLASTTVLFAQNDENWESRTFNMGEFERIKLEGSFRVYLIQGNENLVEVRTTDEEVFDYLEIKNVNSTLKIEEEIKPFNFDRVNLYITFRNLEAINIEGGAKLKTRGYLDLNNFSITVEGGAKIELDMKAENVQVSGEGGVIFELQGVAETLDVHISGAGHVNADELKTKDVTIKVEGVGTSSVYATETLDAKIEGVGKVKYRGNPRVIKSIEGLGKVSPE